MKVVHKPPPMFDEILKAFPHAAGRPLLFAWGDAIHLTNGARITPAKLTHESIHMQRQAGDPASWWRRYIDDKEFRLIEEIPAHYAEYHYLCGGGRSARRRALSEIAKNLSSPLYGSLVTLAVAKRILLVGPPENELQRQMYRSTAAAYDAGSNEQTTGESSTR